MIFDEELNVIGDWFCPVCDPDYANFVPPTVEVDDAHFPADCRLQVRHSGGQTKRLYKVKMTIIDEQPGFLQVQFHLHTLRK